MSLQDRIAEINRINTLLLIKNDRIGRNAHRPDQTVRKMLSPVENEIIGDYEIEFPTSFIQETGETDEYGIPIKKYVKYQMPDAEPELEEEPPMMGDITELEENLSKEFRRYAGEMTKISKKIKAIDNTKKATTAQRNEEKITAEEYAKRINDYDNQIKELKQRESAVSTKLSEIRQNREKLMQDVKNHNAEVLEIRKRNQLKIDEYKEKLNFLNKGAFNTQKGENETEGEYLERLRQTAMVEDPEDELATAVAVTNKKFRMKMREIITDIAKIEQVANGLDPFGIVDNKFKLLKMWNFVKNKFLIAYGFDNKRLTANEIITFLMAFLEKGTTGLPAAIEKEIITPIAPGSIEGLVFSNIPEENTFLITNMATDKHLYLKPVYIGENNYALLYSFTGQKKSFKQFFDGYKSGIPYDRTMPFAESGSYNRKLKSTEEIFNNTGITKQQLLKVFKQNTAEISVNSICKILIQDYNIRPLELTDTEVIRNPYKLTKTGAEVGVQYGYGIKAQNLPKIVPFGEVYLYLQKLFYENVLSIRNKQMKVIAGFRTMKISEPFVKLLMNMLQGIMPTHSDLEMLKTGERQIYDRLIILAKLNKGVVHQKDNTVKELKKRLKLLESEIEIGNNSPLIKKEIYAILHSLKNFKVITQGQIKKYLSQI